MTPLPGSLGDGSVMMWRLDMERFASNWDNGEGAFRLGGRWNSRHVRAVYCSVDPSTSLIEVAVHKGFQTLDRVPHVITSAVVMRTESIHVVRPEDVPDPEWLTPALPRPEQQAFGDDLLARHAMFVIPSVVSRDSWNLIFDPARAAGHYAMKTQRIFRIDPRLAT